ncbi:interleukin-1 beta [Anoplopoma fimbria]|uniref:interleukin-1 beta n=1 Tax=Anoplopoma fimbria TaxID=229290 RepID=UPI0023EAAC7D|nr:interleukin-1 beta [Anoplopoma fimbria]
MSDFDLSQALDSPTNSVEMGFESCDSLNMTEVQEKIIRHDCGLERLVSHDPKTLKSVTTVLLAVNRMKWPLTHHGRELSGDELCSALMESLVTETIVMTTGTSAKAGRNKYERVISNESCTLCDLSQKVVGLNSGTSELQAIVLKGGQGEHRVTFKMANYLNPNVSPEARLAVRLSINDNQHISCFMEDGKAVLKLKECCKQELRNISADGDMVHFLFYRKTMGTSVNTFESVKCPGWFISTSCQDDKSVEMCKVDSSQAPSRCTSFKIN